MDKQHIIHKIYDYLMSTLAAVASVLILLDTIQSLRKWEWVLFIVIYLIFTADLITRLAKAKDKKRFLKHNYMDVIALIPIHGVFPLPFGGRGVMKMFGRDRREQMYLSLEHNVSVDCCPFFIWQTNSDDPRHSFTLGQALTAVGISFEMHLFPEGVHGLALADGNNDLDSNLPHVARWASLCAEWLEEVFNAK